MSDPRPWSSEPANPAQKLVGLSACVPPRPVDLAAGWQRVLVGAQRPQRNWKLVPAFLASVALGAALVLLLRPPVAATQPQVFAAAGARWELRSGEVAIGSGRVTVSSAAVRISTPQLRFELLNGRVATEVTENRTLLVVEEGEVVLRSGTRLKRAEKLSWPPEPEISARLLARAPATPVCEEAGPDQRAHCLEVESLGTGLQAQAALYELGAFRARNNQPALALEAWRSSLERFPRGVLHPEVRIAYLLELTLQRRFAEADRAVRDFEESCPDDPRRADVARLRASLGQLH
jgi:hypothetical protein